MPSKKKKYNARFPAGRIKKIMQSDEEIGKVAQAVPVIISRTLELFVESLLTKTLKVTNSRNAKTLSTSHMKQCIMSEQRFDFLRELVKNIPDISIAEDDAQSSPEEQYPDSDTPYDLSMPSTSTQATQLRSSSSTNGGDGHNNINNGIIKNSNSINNNAVVNHHKRGGIISTACSNSANSVIMHTTSIAQASNNSNSEQSLPLKLTRSDSTPAKMMTSSVIAPTTAATSKPIWRPIETSPTTPRKRLKQQSHSMSYSNSNNNNTNTNTSILQKQQQQYQVDNALYQKQPQTAIPAPIVNFDFCTKPIVKIDYSNLPLSTSPTCTTTAPMSAPILGQQQNNNKNNATIGTAFSFDVAAPVISIDLSNMVTTATDKTNTNAVNKPVINGPAIATISIGALQLATADETAVASPIAASAIASNLASPIIMPTAVGKPSSHIATPTTVSGTKNNALFELDEDYDNI